MKRFAHVLTYMYAYNLPKFLTLILHGLIYKIRLSVSHFWHSCGLGCHWLSSRWNSYKGIGFNRDDYYAKFDRSLRKKMFTHLCGSCLVLNHVTSISQIHALVAKNVCVCNAKQSMLQSYKLCIRLDKSLPLKIQVSVHVSDTAVTMKSYQVTRIDMNALSSTTAITILRSVRDLAITASNQGRR